MVMKQTKKLENDWAFTIQMSVIGVLDVSRFFTNLFIANDP